MLALFMALGMASVGATETSVTLASEPAPLYGTMLRPNGELVAGAIIIPGSGPTDGDGNSPLGVRSASLKKLAEGLATYNIATVRIDKRGVARSQPAGFSESELRFDQMAEDVRGWATQTARALNQPCVWLIGHSEGALVAQVAASQPNSDICGLVLLSGAGRAAGTVIREQLNGQLPEPLKTQAFDALSELEAGRTVSDSPPALSALLRPSVQPYLISWLKYDPAKLAADYQGPMFIGQGTTDLQTTVADAQALAAARPEAQLKLWEGVNHTLTAAPADRAENLATYANPEAPLADPVLTDVAVFIRFSALQ